MLPPKIARALPALALALCAALLIWHAGRYDFVTDDALISFVYSRNFARHNALVYNFGMDPVEGYTNFLWTFLLGMLMKLGWMPEHSSLVLGPACGIGTMLCVARLMRWAREDAAYTTLDAMPAALLAASAGYACWSSGGLETQLFTLLVTAALTTYAISTTDDPRWLRATGALLAGAAMTRPEGLLVTGAIGLHRVAHNLIAQRRVLPTREELISAGCFLIVWAPWFAWRWSYYGYPFPNTYYVKAGGEPPAGYKEKLFENGLYYIKRWTEQTHVTWALPLILGGLLVQRPGGRRLFLGALLVPLSVLYALYVARVGGDFMGLHRFIMPLFVWAALGTALGLHALAQRLPQRARPVIWAAALALCAGFVWQQQGITEEATRWGNWRNDRGIDTPSFLRLFSHDQGLAGAAMRTCFKDEDFAIAGGAGAQVYYGDFKAVDVFGLVDEQIAHNVPPSNPRAGHNKHAPYDMLLTYDPTFLFFCSNIHQEPHQDAVACHESWWRAHGYDKATIAVPGLRNGKYYSFMKRKDRDLSACPGLVRVR